MFRVMEIDYVKYQSQEEIPEFLSAPSNGACLPSDLNREEEEELKISEVNLLLLNNIDKLNDMTDSIILTLYRRQSHFCGFTSEFSPFREI